MEFASVCYAKYSRRWQFKHSSDQSCSTRSLIPGVSLFSSLQLSAPRLLVSTQAKSHLPAQSAVSPPPESGPPVSSPAPQSEREEHKPTHSLVTLPPTNVMMCVFVRRVNVQILRADTKLLSQTLQSSMTVMTITLFNRQSGIQWSFEKYSKKYCFI